MDNKNYERLLNTLVKKGVCKTGKRYLKTTNKNFDVFIRVMKGWPEYLYEHSQEAVKQCRKFIEIDDKKELTSKGVFLDSKGVYEVKNHMSPIFVLGDSNVVLEVPNFETIKVYVFNNSTANIRAKENSYIDVEVWDNSHVQTLSNKVVAYVYDKGSVEGPVKKYKKTYEKGKVFNGKEVL